MKRRAAVRIMAGGAAAMIAPIPTSYAGASSGSSQMLMRTIPSSGEKLPVIGLGTWQTFDAELSPARRQPLEEVLSVFARSGGRVIDSSPMYGRSEAVIGELVSALKLEKLFLATKVWTRGREAGIESMERSFAKLKTKRIDLMQVHNLVDVKTQLATIREWKAQGRIRYVGITHYESGAFAEVEKVLWSEALDFLQINYSITDRAAEDRLLPLAKERNMAVLINRPFGGGDLFRRVHAKPLPDWAAEMGCKSWAAFLLKWIVSHPAVTCAIPATNNPAHLADNMEGGKDPMPNAKMRDKMADFVAAL